MTHIDSAYPSSHFFTSLRTRLHYLDWGNPSAPTLVLVHGGLDHAHSWDWVARALSPDWHVIAPDLRGHGDSAWSVDGTYPMNNFVYDLTQLVQLQGDAPVAMIGHSLGGSIALRYTGLFPDRVSKLVAIEGLGFTPAGIAEKLARPVTDRWLDWISERQGGALRTPRRYPDIDAATARMHQENAHLSPEQARHLTIHGINRNEDGSYSWKFDHYLKSVPPHGADDAELPDFWRRISCPTLLCLGLDSWASNPIKDGRAAHFQDARLVEFANAGHWLHHDQFDRFMTEIRAFL